MKTLLFLLAAALPLAAADSGSGKTLGNPAAPIRLELFSDFSCPGCKALHEQLLPILIRDFVTPGKVYIVFRDYVLPPNPGHQFSPVAARYATAASRVGKYQQVADALFQTQSSWAVSGKVWEAVAPALTPAEQKKVQALIVDPTVAAEVQSDLEQGMAAHVDRTPTLVMTRKGKQTPWSSWGDYGLFKSMADLLLSK